MRKNGKSGEIEALIKLLDEPDEFNFRNIRNQLASYGLNIIPYLEYHFDMTSDDLIRRRLDEIIDNIFFSDLKTGFSKWVIQRNGELMKAMFLLARIKYPQLHESWVTKQVEELRRDIWLEMTPNLTMLEKVNVMNHIFFKIYDFQIVSHRDADPAHLNLADLLDSRTGTSLLVGMLYIIICQKLNLPVAGIDFPNNFLLAYLNSKGEDRISFLKENEVIFYINPGNEGAIYNRKDLDNFFHDTHFEPRTEFYRPCDNRKLIKRLISKMFNAYKDRGLADKTEKLSEIESIITQKATQKQL